MRIVNTTCIFPPEMDLYEIIDRMVAAGFIHLDFALGKLDMPLGSHPLNSDNWKEYTLELKTYAESKGAVFTMPTV